MTVTEFAYETGQSVDTCPVAPPPFPAPPRVFEKLAVVMAAGDPAWPRVEAVLRPHLRSGRTALSLWPVSGETEEEMARDMAAALGAIAGLIWDEVVDSVLILGSGCLVPTGPGLFLDPVISRNLHAIPAPVLIAGPSEDDPGFGAAGWEGMRTPEAMAAAIAATVAHYPTVLERAASHKNKQ